MVGDDEVPLLEAGEDLSSGRARRNLGESPEAKASLRFYRWVTKTQRERSKLVREIVPLVLQRGPKVGAYLPTSDPHPSPAHQ